MFNFVRQTFRLIAENVFAPPSWISKIVRRVVSIWQPVTYVTILNIEKNKNKSLSYIKKAYYLNYSYSIHAGYFSYI